ncbi:hypothetical protein [Listeria marthii]|uniref:hypothetical protein n=1 Tax=Listeria marthii TaxID=529731 RepID=UPI0018893764|nr:hypothetical protein [Listeria marthii]MBF2392460.1 hypothetical protein [Listeria marthii]MBF2502277.1 hypothetical protein [Listeria marthii]MBF2626669.1 hypothetical protein [Listeria marthii]
MGQHYYFNKNRDSKGKHEIHTDKCSFLPELSNREYIGYEDSSVAAKKRAEREYPSKKFDGCYYCCNSIHTG